MNSNFVSIVIFLMISCVVYYKVSTASLAQLQLTGIWNHLTWVVLKTCPTNFALYLKKSSLSKRAWLTSLEKLFLIRYELIFISNGCYL